MMHQESPLYNLEKLSGIDQKNNSFVKDVVTVFLTTIPVDSAKMVKACEEQNWPQVYFYAHKMKASIDLLSIESIRQEIRTVERCAKSQANLEEIPERVKLINNTVLQCAKELKEHL